MMSRARCAWTSLLLLPIACASAQPHTGVSHPPAAATSATELAFAKSGIADWTLPPPPTAEPAFVPPVSKRVALPNGIAVVIVEQHTLPIVSLTLVAAGAGSAADPNGKAGLAAYTADLLDEGAGKLSAIELAEEQARLGAEIELDVDADSAQLSADTLSATLDETLELISQIVTQPRFDPAEAARVRGDRETALALRQDRPREVAGLVLSAALYGANSPYGHPVSGMPEDLARIGVGDVRAFYAARWKPASTTLVVAGDVQPATLIASLTKTLGRWRPPANKVPPAWQASAVKPPGRLLLVDRRGAKQSDVRIGLIGPERKDPRFYAFEVFRTVLGGGFTSRLIQRLREELGITYSAYAGMDWRVQPGPFVIASAFVTEATAQGLAETIKIIDDLGSNELSADELDNAKQNMIRALPERFETNAHTAATFADLALLGLPDDWYAHYAEGVRRVTGAEVQAIARTLVPSDKLVFSVVGDLASAGSALDQLGLGTGARYDLEGKPLGAAAKTP